MGQNSGKLGQQAKWQTHKGNRTAFGQKAVEQ